MQELRAEEENRLLARVTFATSLGDFISYFAVLLIVQDISKSTALAAYTVAVKTLGVALGGAFFPRVASWFGFRTLLIWSQFFSGVLIAGLFVLSLYPSQGAAFCILGILFVQTILKQFFESAREARSRIIEDGVAAQAMAKATVQRGFQAQLLQGFYSAQILGPLLSYVFIRKLGVHIPLVFDALTFFVAAWLCRKVGHDFETRRFRIFRPLEYIWRRPEMLSLFLIRSVGMWIPIGIFNYVLFVVIADYYKIDLLNSAWVYIAIGVGSLISTSLLRSQKGWWSQRQDATVAVFGFALLALTRLAFINLHSFYWALLVLALGGICNGANATVTQSLRRKICSAHELPEIMGLELFVGRLCDWGVSTLLLYFMTRGMIGYKEGIYLSMGSLLVLSAAMLLFRRSFPRI